jgi:hypothetical protein
MTKNTMLGLYVGTFVLVPWMIAPAGCSPSAGGGGTGSDSGAPGHDGGGDAGGTETGGPDGSGPTDASGHPDGGGGGPDGSKPTDGGGTDGPPTKCTYTATGAATGTGTCTVGVAYGGKTSQLVISMTGATGYFTFSTQLGSTATFSPGTYTYAEVPVAGADWVVIPDAWDMSKGSVDGVTPQGDFTLNITSVGPEDMLDGSDLWPTAHGNLNITLPPKTGDPASGNVTVEVNF